MITEQDRKVVITPIYRIKDFADVKEMEKQLERKIVEIIKENQGTWTVTEVNNSIDMETAYAEIFMKRRV